MKKVLFATAALIATGSVAAAEVTFGGYGRFGMQYQENRGAGLDNTRVESRFRMDIDAETTSDIGVRFGARVRVQADENNDGSANAAVFNGPRFFAESGGFRLEVGNIADAVDNMYNYYGYEPGLSAPVGQYSNTNLPVSAYSSTGTGTNGVSAIYSFGDFRGQLSGSKDTDVGPLGAEDRISAGVSYAFSGWTVALAYTAAEQAPAGSVKRDGTVLTVGGSLGMVDVAMLVADDSVEGTSYGISGKYKVGAATSILASVSAGGDDVTTTKKTAFGVGFDHSLGGGVNLRGMLGRDNASNNVADLGVQFSF
jgi:outer membrane protein OmpU